MRGRFDTAGLLLWILLLVVLLAATDPPEAARVIPVPDYPAAPRGDTVDTYHGDKVADPWRWLEELDAPATREWMREQNRLTSRYIGSLAGRDAFARRLRRLMDYERYGVPRREAGVYVFAHNPGQAEQDALRVTADPRRPGRVLVDPLDVRPDGTVSLGSFTLSPDGRWLAYALSDGGSDWKTWRVRGVRDGRDGPERLQGIKFSGASWARDASGFYYSRYPRDTTGWDDGRQARVYFHRLGTEQDEDRLIYAVTDHPTREPYGEVTEDGRYLVITVQDGFVTNGVYYMTLGADGLPAGGAEAVRLLDAWDARYEFLGADGDVFYFLTTHSAPRGRVVAIPLNAAAPGEWLEIVPEGESVIVDAALIGGRLLLNRQQDAHARLSVHDLKGEWLYDPRLPGKGTVEGFTGSSMDPETFFIYSDFTTPRTLYRLDVASGERTLIHAPDAGTDPRRFVTEQVFFDSRDGTRVPMYIVRRRDVAPDGRRPTVLYGYGGFNVSLLPAWSAARMAWIEAGGVYAQAGLRGGGEYGDAWHRAGIRHNKQNVFDDFAAAAEALIDRGWTSPRHLAAWGGSNGGLLVAAVLNQRPELFAAGVPAVGVLDMLRYHTASLNARKWASDYGLSEDPADYPVLRAYSPYHNLQDGRCYPAVLVQADANDDRVAAWHSYKYAAALQAVQARAPDCRRPALIRIETRSGHGAGASLTKLVDEYADQWAFLAAATGLRPPPDATR